METWRLKVKYRGDKHYTLITSTGAIGSLEKVTTYLNDHYAFIRSLGGTNKIKLVKETVLKNLDQSS